MTCLLLADKWSTAWLMTGLGVGVVFTILVLLILVLQIFSVVFAEKNKQRAKKAVTKVDFKEQLEGYEEDMAAVATAVFLYLNSAHDEESGVLTIVHQEEHSHWHSALNETV